MAGESGVPTLEWIGRTETDPGGLWDFTVTMSLLKTLTVAAQAPVSRTSSFAKSGS